MLAHDDDAENQNLNGIVFWVTLHWTLRNYPRSALTLQFLCLLFVVTFSTGYCTTFFIYHFCKNRIKSGSLLKDIWALYHLDLCLTSLSHLHCYDLISLFTVNIWNVNKHAVLPLWLGKYPIPQPFYLYDIAVWHITVLLKSFVSIPTFLP
jgi:hypothetical protein